MRLVFFGASRYVLPILEVLRRRLELSLVVTTEPNPTDAVPAFCAKHGIPCVSVSSSHQLTTNYELRTTNAPLAVLAYFGLILPKTILDLFPKGILNLHPSLLPKYRGPTPGQTAILHADAVTGVTLIRLDEEVDHGPILTQVEEPIQDEDTADSLYERLFAIGAKLLDKYIDKYIKEQLKASPQNHRGATFTNRLTRNEGFIDPQAPPDPKTLNRMIRAYHPWPGVYTKLRMKSEKLKIVKFLPEKRIQVEGGKPMSVKDFLNGYPEAKEVLSKTFSL